MKQLIIYILLSVFSTLICSNFSNAEKMYKYKGKNGTWHFSNIPPATEQPVKVSNIRVKERKNRVSVKRRDLKDKVEFYVYNEFYGPIEFEFLLKEFTNVQSKPLLPVRLVIPAYKEVLAVTLMPANPFKSWSYRCQYIHLPGDPKASHNPQKPYGLPFESGVFNISQAFNGKASHTHPQSRYAVDIPMPEGTNICAARAGIIMDIANDFFTGGAEESFGERANFIRILHDDGTMAVYAHLKLESAKFPLGTRVSEGQVIAESGNTGFSTGPHLHFVIQKNTGMNLVSIPFKFEGKGEQGVTPVFGMVLSK